MQQLSKVFSRILFHVEAQEGGLKKYTTNTGWFLITRICSLLFSFFITIYVIRYLGPANYGTFSYAVSFVSLFSFVASLGIDQVVYRELIRNPEKEGELLGSALALKLISGTIAVILTVVSAMTLGVSQIELTLITIIALTLFGSAFQIITYSYQARAQSKYPALITLGVSIILAIAKLLVIWFDKGIIFFALVLVLESLLYAAFFIFIYHFNHRRFYTWRVRANTLRMLVITSLPLMLSSVSMVIYARIDQVMLNHYINTTAVGIYDAAVRLSDVWYIIPNTILGALFPAIINAQKTSMHLFRKRILMCAGLLFSLNILIILPTTILAPYIIDTLYGSAYSQSTTVLSIYIWSLIGFSLGQLMNTLLIAQNNIYIYLYTSIVTVLINVLLNVLLIPSYGIAGAAFATLVSYSAIPILPFAFNRVRHYFVLK